MASVRGMTPEAILALIKRELANVKLSEGQIRDLIQTNTDLVDSIVNLEDQVKAGLTGDALDQLDLELQQLKTELQSQAEALATADTTLQETAQALIDNELEMAVLSALLSDEGFLNTEKIKPGTIIGEHLAGQTVTALNIASGAIVSEKISADAITANHILAESITGDRLVARTVGADRLVADSITANEISSGAITTNEIAAGAVSAENISAEGISADLITAGSLSATRVELDGNDLSTQMQFILSEMDRKFQGVETQVNALIDSASHDLGFPVFSAFYGDFNVPLAAYDRFASWVNLSHDMRNDHGQLALIALRVLINAPVGGWSITFSRSFEGRIQTYSGGQPVMEYIQDPSKGSFPIIELEGIDRLSWYHQSQSPYVYGWVDGYNVGGARVRNPGADYSYINPIKVIISFPANDAAITDAVRRAVSTTNLPSVRTRGTAGGKNFLQSFSTDNTAEEYVYPSDPATPHLRRLTYFATELEGPVASIQIRGTMRIGQPRRMDSYGFAVFNNDRLLDYVYEGGVGTLSGGSIIFSHEEISFSKTFQAPLYPGSELYVIPIVIEQPLKPNTDAFIMNWEVTIVTIPQ